MASNDPARRAAENVARESFGRLLAWLAWQWKDIAAAEDALSDALLAALEVWPVRGVPDAPDSWILSVAKRNLLQMARHDRVRFDPAVTALFEGGTALCEQHDIPDARLTLMFVCAHPAIDPQVRVPLMLQTVLGLQVADMAPALMVSPTALAQRLVRAKQKIRDAAVRFEEPDAADVPVRLQYVLEAIYGAYGVAMDALDGAEARITDLQEESLFLGSLVCALQPMSAEAKGLWSLMTMISARAKARGDADTFVQLAEQDTALWNRQAIVIANRVLWEAARLNDPGPFQLEAAIQSAHCQRAFAGHTPWKAICQLYERLNGHFPTHGARVAGAVAAAESGDIPGAIQLLDAMDARAMASFQPWWVARAHVLAMAGQRAAAADCYTIAIGLSYQSRIRQHLRQKQREMAETPPQEHSRSGETGPAGIIAIQ